MSVGLVFACHRLRWQVELAFKLMKTILRFGKLPNHREDAARTWLLAKRINALLLERLARADQRAFPAGEVAA
jgi:IS4 transposase